MHLQIGPVSLQLERTADFSVKPRLDDTGLDVLWYEVSCGMVCVWQPWATATATAPVAPAPGDALGITVRNLRTVLMQPRQQVTLTIGPDRCFTSPLSGPFAVGTVLPCDPMGGPFVDDVQILEILGDTCATVLVRVRFAYNDDDHFVVSNRWSIRSRTDATSWLTTRTVTGKAVLRMDFLQTANAPGLNPTFVPDQWRRNFILPVPAGFMRKSVDVVATPDGAQLGYTVVDQQMRLNLGGSSDVTAGMITKVRGDVTVGLDFPFRALIGGMVAGASIAGTFAGAARTAWGLHQAQWWAGAFTIPKCKVVVQVTGNHLAGYAMLASAAKIVCLDRLAPAALAGQLIFMSSYLSETFDADAAPTVQLSMEVLPLGPNVLAALMNPTRVDVMMNTTTDIGTTAADPGGVFGGRPLFSGNPAAVGNPQLPNSNNTRGSYVAALVGQVLATGSVPAGTYVPVAPVPADGVPPRNDLGLA